MNNRFRSFLGVAAAVAAAPAFGSQLVVLVDLGTEMPMSQFVSGKLVGGIHKDVGEALATAMGRKPSYLALPRKRIGLALENGRADILCSYMPEWLPGPFDWTQGFLPIVELLVADRKAEAPRSIKDLADHPIGTVLGFSHPEIESVLGSRFVREDAQNSETNLRKLAAGRIQYALTSKDLLDYRMRQGDLRLQLHPPIVVQSYLGQCAVSRKAHVKVAEVDAAISLLVKEGTVSRILKRYQ